MHKPLKILLVGNDPHMVAGVPNYTRPLAIEFTRLGHRVYYFYSGITENRYNWFFKPYLRFNRKDFPFECAEIINAPKWEYNYNDPLIDIHNRQIEILFKKYIENIQPDIMHIHSRLGLPVSIIAIAAEKGIKVFNTIHVFGMLCPKRVMMDNEGLLCNGPGDLRKCTMCFVGENIQRAKWKARLMKIHPNLPVWLLKVKNVFRGDKFKEKSKADGTESQKFDKKRFIALQARLKYMIDLMNKKIDINICVSNDVKNTLMQFGVNENKTLVQHIGSVIAEKQKTDFHDVHNPLVIGNIGGVGYYKGIHVLLDAVTKVKNKNFIVKIFGKFDNQYKNKIMQGKKGLPVEFFGRYRLDELPAILDQIDIMVLPSICKDTAPQTIFESFSAKIPIVASHIGGFPDFVQDGWNGYLFDAGNSKQLAGIIDDILSNPEKVNILAKNTPHLKTIPKNATEIIEIYLQSQKKNR